VVEFSSEIPVVSALLMASEHGGAAEALRAMGFDLEDLERLDGMSAEIGRLLAGRTPGEAVAEALALGYLAGRVAQRPRPRRSFDATSFLMDHDLVVGSAEGQSILRLPWFEEGLFVGRQLPDISEMPTHVRRLAVRHYRAALAGERGRYEFTSYGHSYAVEAVPVRNEAGRIEGVLGVATPARPNSARARAALAHERTAEALERTARLAEHQADIERLAGHTEAEAVEREAAEQAHTAAREAQAAAWRLRSEIA
jgi:hypothetical protein